MARPMVQGKHRFLVQLGSYDDRKANYLGLDRIGDEAFFMGIVVHFDDS